MARPTTLPARSMTSAAPTRSAAGNSIGSIEPEATEGTRVPGKPAGILEARPAEVPPRDHAIPYGRVGGCIVERSDVAPS